MLASTDDERAQLATLYDADAERIEIVPPGVDHAVFSPGDRAAARQRLGLDGRRVLLFVGRIQPLKGVDLAVRCLAALDDPTATLVVVGGPSGADGDAELARVHALVDELGVADQVRFVPPQPHDRARRLLPRRRRVPRARRAPSRSGSSRSRRPRAARRSSPAAVGGLRSLVDDGDTGFLVEGRDPADYAAPVATLLDDPELAAEMGANASAALASLLVEHHRRAAAPALRRPRRTRPRALRLTRPRCSTTLDLALDPEFLAREARADRRAPRRAGRARAVGADRRVRPEIPRWYVRFGCDGRDAATIYFDLHQRTLRYEVYFLPDPPAHHEELYRFLLQRNHTMYGAHFSIGPDGDCYLVGRVLLEHLDVAELDRIIGVLYERRTVVPARDPHRLPPR